MKPEIYPELKRIENELKAIKVMIMESKELPKKNVSFRGMAKQLVSDKELTKSLKEAKSAIFK